MPRIWFIEPAATRRTTTTQHVGWNFNHFARTFGENDFWRCRWGFYDWFDVVCVSHSRNGVNGLASSRLYWQSTTVLSDQLTNFMSRKSDDRGLNRKFIQIRRFNRQKSTFRGLFLSSDTLLTSFCYFNFGFISELLLRRAIFLDSWSSDFSSFKSFTLKTFANCAAERERFLEKSVYAEFKGNAESRNLHEEIVATTAIRIAGQDSTTICVNKIRWTSNLQTGVVL